MPLLSRLLWPLGKITKQTKNWYGYGISLENEASLSAEFEKTARGRRISASDTQAFHTETSMQLPFCQCQSHELVHQHICLPAPVPVTIKGLIYYMIMVCLSSAGHIMVTLLGVEQSC